MNEAITARERASRRGLLGLWFTSTERVDRRTYLTSVIVLGLLSYAVDAAIVYAYTGRLLGVLQHLNPLLAAKALPDGGPQVAPLASWVLGSLPLLWVWASLSIRRSVDAGLGAYVGLLVLVPVVSWVVVAILATVRSETEPTVAGDTPAGWLLSLSSLGVAGLVGVLALTSSVFAFQSYGAALFVATPLLQGCVVGYACSRDGAGFGRAAGLAQLAVLITGLMILSLALEGAVCLAMAYPIAAALALLGAALGHAVGRARHGQAVQLAGILLTLPLLLGAETQRAAAPLREVVSVVEIDAPAAVIWPEVVGFGELPPISEWVFRLGIAHPVRARIEGRGVGAVRYCEFSTGPFVEPITRWDEPYRLSFDVRSQPAPMHEWSPYQHVNAPHLLHSFRSKRGEFRLIPLPDGRTRLEGSTWYELDMAPQIYWTVFSDRLIHAIHDRVLQHIKERAERRSNVAT